MSGKRGRKPSKIDQKAKLERSRQSARECRARKKLRYQYLEELVASRGKAVKVLKDELENVKKQCEMIDRGAATEDIKAKIVASQLQTGMDTDSDQTSNSGSPCYQGSSTSTGDVGKYSDDQSPQAIDSAKN